MYNLLTSHTDNPLVSQWAAELADRAPSLKVFIYTGIQNLAEDFNYDCFLDYDVILMSYSILSKEVHYATPPPKRNMIEGSVTAAAKVACMLSSSVLAPSKCFRSN
jgi:hypothetical protein